MKITSVKIKDYFLILVAVLILLAPDILLNYNENFIDFALTFVYKVFFLLFLVTVIFYFTKSFYWTYILIGIPYLISLCVETISVSVLGGYTTLDTILAVTNTLDTEVNEFLSRFYIYLFIPVVIVVLFILIARKLKSIDLPKPTHKYMPLWALLFLLLSCSFSFYLLTKSDIYKSGRDLKTYFIKHYYIKQHPLSLYYRIYEFNVYKKRVAKFKDIKKSFTFEVSNPNDSLNPKLVVLIIGERIRYDHLAINGYKRETTPNLKKFKNLISFSKNYSNANSTANSIPLILTQGTPKEHDKIYSQKTIVSLYKEAGYKTYWISSQANCFGFIDNKFEMDKLYEVYNNKNHTDLDILPTFSKVINEQSSKNKLVVINMVGGHGSVPEKFRIFEPNNNGKHIPVDKKNIELFVNGYDNMIVLQDYVISNLIKEIKALDEKSVLLFTSDHATNLFDNDSKNIFGYGSANPTIKETHVPLLIWGSEKYINANHKFKNLTNHKDLLTTNDNVFFTLADLSNIQYKSYKRENSLADSLYFEPKSRSVFVNNSIFEFKNN